MNTEQIANYIEAHGFAVVSYDRESVTFKVYWTRRDGTSGFILETASNLTEAREALGY